MKKFLVCLVLILFLICSCAGIELLNSNTRTTKFGPVAYTMPIAIPDFSDWRGYFAPMHKAIGFGIIGWSAVNPKNSDECVELLIAIEDAQSDDPTPYIMVLIHVVSIKEMRMNFYADMKYLNTGKPSFEFTEQKKAPNIEKFIVMKEDQFAKKVVI